jgi:polysaccharide export outer membrane protein
MLVFIRTIFGLLLLCILFRPALAEPYQYTINAGDVLNISVWKEETLQQELRVLPDGTISFPLAGVIHVAGKNIKTIQTELTEKIAKYVNDPVVNITVKSVEGNVVYILGQVKTPGHFIMLAQTDVMQALSLAGGLTPFAKANSILILRRNVKGSEEAIKFEYGELETGDELDKNHLLKSGDVIVVP